MKKTLIVFSFSALIVSCQKNEQSGVQSLSGKSYATSPGITTGNQVGCTKVAISSQHHSVTIGQTSYNYPNDLIDLSGLPRDADGNATLLTNCLGDFPSEEQKAMHHRTDSIMNLAADAFRAMALGKPKLPRAAPYTLQEFQFAMDNTPWPVLADGADYVSTIFNKTICKNPDIPKLPGISAALIAVSLPQNKNFTEITLAEAINYTNKAEAFVIAVGLSGGKPSVTVIDSRKFRYTCACEPIEQVVGRTGPGANNTVRLASYFDYDTTKPVHYFMYAGD
ncbi:hypothetical protein [Chitinophaga sp.]|uniref:hypothetical protein n=1 Tax=Chitinophaga sp. TaxID=1869181 RepID=UPI002F924CC3